MTEDELVRFLTDHQRTLETIQSILEGTSVVAVQRRARKEYGHELPSDIAEDTAKRWRREFVESVTALLNGGAWWDEGSQTYVNRNDFS